MKIITVFPCLFSLALVPFVSAAQPNIVFIMADDFGLGDVGRQYEERTGQAALAPTPTLDALANEGLWFSDAHSPTALCSPSRYAVMTGNYNYRSYAPWGVWGTFRPTAIATGDTTLGLVAQNAGYNTGFIGKWHLGGDFYKKGTTEIFRGKDRTGKPLDVDLTKWVDFGPQDLGFDYDYTLPTGIQGPIYMAFEDGIWAPFSPDSEIIHYDERTAKDPFFISDKGAGPGDSEWDTYKINEILAEKAAGFIERSASQAEPFFLCYWSPTVHVPHAPPVELDGKPIRGSTPSHHTDMNRVFDWEVEKIVTALKAANVYDDTIIILTSDNGGLWDPVAEKVGHLSNGGIVRGTKNHPWEGGHLVPLIVTWPGVIPANSRSDVLINGTDILATLADIVGGSLFESQAKDSYSFYPLLKGDTSFQARDEVLLQAGAQCELVLRQGDWKLVMQSDWELSKMEPIALFNLANNPKEADQGNLIHNPEYASKVAAMHAHYIKVRNNPNRTVAFP